MERTAIDPNRSAAREAGLHYVSDLKPGFSRRGKAYLDQRGRKIRDADTLARIRSIVIPPAWTGVWICPDALGHIQATGRDARGRKQYRYHPRWRSTRDSTKYHKMIAFARALPAIRKAVARDLKKQGLPREKVLATVVKLLEVTLIRVGNAEYARQNDSFGLTTMRDRHAKINGSQVKFLFKGKSGVEHEIELRDPRLAKIIKRSQDLPGYELFQYVDEAGKVCDVGSADVNEYLREIAGDEFSAKDFRTWAGTVLAAMALKEFESFTSQKQANRNIVEAVEGVAKKLGNTRAVCRKCYIHPAILESYLDGTLVEILQKKIDRKISGGHLRPEEGAVLGLLRMKLR